MEKSTPEDAKRWVALRKESVDRNYIIKITGTAPRRVALRKESVDRNAGGFPTIKAMRVALRKESVDRNIRCHLLNIPAGKVALRKESVDRNGHGVFVAVFGLRRSPQGERG